MLARAFIIAINTFELLVFRPLQAVRRSKDKVIVLQLQILRSELKNCGNQMQRERLLVQVQETEHRLQKDLAQKDPNLKIYEEKLKTASERLAKFLQEQNREGLAIEIFALETEISTSQKIISLITEERLDVEYSRTLAVFSVRGCLRNLIFCLMN